MTHEHMNGLELDAHMAGYNDAINGRVYRDSADVGTRNRQHLDHYEGGWYLGRRELDERSTTT